MTEYETRTIAINVCPKGQPLFSEMTTEVRIVDQATGEYVEVEQTGSTGLGKIAINSEEWPALRSAIDQMIAECRYMAVDTARTKELT